MGCNWKYLSYLLLALISCSPKTSKEYCNIGLKKISKDKVKAEQYLIKAIELDSLNAKAYYGIGVIHMHSNDTKAIQYFLRAVSIDSKLADSWNLIGYIYLHKGYKYSSEAIEVNSEKIKMAITYFNKAILTDSTIGLYHYQRGFSYNLLGDTIQSKIDFNRSCSLGFQTACTVTKKQHGHIQER